MLLNRKYKAKFEVVLAISEDKIEVHPKSQPSGTTRFWSKQKSLVYNTDSLVACIVSLMFNCSCRYLNSHFSHRTRLSDLMERCCWSSC